MVVRDLGKMRVYLHLDALVFCIGTFVFNFMSTRAFVSNVLRGRFCRLFAPRTPWTMLYQLGTKHKSGNHLLSQKIIRDFEHAKEVPREC